MISNNWAGLGFAFASGIIFGLAYFGGLWLTVKNIQRVQNPRMTTIFSLIGRLALLMTGMYLVSDGNAARIVACLLGFVITRTVWINRLMPEVSDTNTGVSDYGTDH